MNASVSLKFPPRSLSIIDQSNAIYLRPLTIFDATIIDQAVQESIVDLRQFMPWAHTPQTEVSQFERLRSVQAAYWAGKDFGMGMFRQKDDAFIGGFGMHPRTLNPRALEIGYWVRTSEQNKGLATLGTKMLICLGFSYFELERIQCGYNTANLASARVNDKVGFHHEGILRCFEISSSQAMRLNGDIRSDENALRSLLREHLPQLGWYPGILEKMDVVNWKGEKVPKPRMPRL